MLEKTFIPWFPKLNKMGTPFTIDELANGGWYDHPEWILRQYTGLKDKNGKEIYEGDIVSTTFDKTDQYEQYTEVGVVKFQSLQWLIADDKHGKNNRFYSHSEVIGNIYENPELLQQQE